MLNQITKILQNNVIDSFLVLDNKLSIIEKSENLNASNLEEFKSLFWIEDSHKLSNFLDKLKKSGNSVTDFEINFDTKGYKKYKIVGLFQSNKYYLFWGEDSKEYYNLKELVAKQAFTINSLNKLNSNIIFKLSRDFKIIEILNSQNTIFENELPRYINNSLFDFVHPSDLENLKIYLSNQLDLNYTIEIRLKVDLNDNYWIKIKQIQINKENDFICLEIDDIDYVKNKLIELENEKNQALHLANHLEQSRENERKEMAREIHDEIGHALTSLKLEMNILLKKKFLREDTLHNKLNDMMKHIEETIRMLQRISAQLRPSILDHFGLIAAVEWQAKEFQRQTSIRCKYSLPDEDVQIPESITIAIFRIFQEILTNITRHSQATRVDVNLVVENNSLELRVADNGIGIKKEYQNSSNSLGLIGMSERAKLINGNLSINSVLNVGTTITLVVKI
jgi:signal transduction histidine kinase